MRGAGIDIRTTLFCRDPVCVLVHVAAEAEAQVSAGEGVLWGFLRALLLRVVCAVPGASGVAEPRLGSVLGVGGSETAPGEGHGRAHVSGRHAAVTHGTRSRHLSGCCKGRGRVRTLSIEILGLAECAFFEF